MEQGLIKGLSKDYPAAVKCYEEEIAASNRIALIDTYINLAFKHFFSVENRADKSIIQEYEFMLQSQPVLLVF